MFLYILYSIGFFVELSISFDYYNNRKIYILAHLSNGIDKKV